MLVPLSTHAQYDGEVDGIVYHVFPKLERYIGRTIRSIPKDRRKKVTFLIDTKQIQYLHGKLASVRNKPLYEIAICNHRPYSEYDSGYYLVINRIRYNVFLKSTDEAFSYHSCNINYAQFEGKNFIRYQGDEFNAIIVDNENRKFYTINTLWKLERKLRNDE